MLKKLRIEFGLRDELVKSTIEANHELNHHITA